MIDQTRIKSSLTRFLYRFGKPILLFLLVLALVLILATQNSAFFITVMLINDLIFVIYIIKVYINEEFSDLVNKFFIFVCYFSTFAIFAILPLDFAQTSYYRKQGYTNNNQLNPDIYNKYKQDLQHFKDSYQAIYIIQLINNVVIFGLLVQINLNGYLSIKSRIINTIKNFIKSIIKLIIAFVVCLLVCISFLKMNEKFMMSVVMIISNTYGIVVLVLLLGYGLFQLPIYIWRKTNVELNIDNLLSKSAQLFKDYRNYQMELQSSIKEFDKLLVNIPKHDPIYCYVSYIKNELPRYQELLGSASTQLTVQSTSKSSLDKSKDIDEEVVANARAKLKLNKENLQMALNSWEKNYNLVMGLTDQSYLENPSKKREDSFDRPDRKLVPIKYNRPQQIQYKVTAVLIVVVSLIIVLQELMVVFTQDDKALLFGTIKKSLSENMFAEFTLILLILWLLGYIIFSAYFALFNLSFSKQYQLSVKNTSQNTLISSAKFCAQLSFPLCFNTLILFNDVEKEKEKYVSGFVQFYKPVTEIPVIGDNYNIIVPLLISFVGYLLSLQTRIFTILTLSSGFRGLLFKVSKGKLNFDNDEKYVQKVVEGEKVVVTEYQKSQRQLRMMEMQQKVQKNDDSTLDFEKQLKQDLINKNEQQEDCSQVKIMCGYLKELSKNKQYFFQMEKYTFVQYKDNEDYKVVKKMQLHDLEGVEVGDGCQIVLKFKDSNEVRLGAKDKEERDDWFQFLQYKFTIFQVDEI